MKLLIPARLNKICWLLAKFSIVILLATNVQANTDYIGSARCASCHSEQYLQWQKSHHYQAMQPASSSTVSGDFDNASFKHFDVETQFFIREGKYYVNTQGADGKYKDYQIDYTFGFEPLQQYLVKFPGGRYQALTTAWDNRPKEHGGQHWFHLYPDQSEVPGGVLHWTGSYFNWNLRCAECHSTGLEKNYSLEKNSYDTRWQEINVGCEACHGAGAEHLEWVAAGSSGYLANKGFPVDITRSGDWYFTGGNTATNTFSNPEATQLDVCATCHSRRSILADPIHGEDFLNSHQLALLTPDLYYSDGQIREEVYVYGSFLQSKMHKAGVMCSDCHNPHSGQVFDQGNGLCTACHKAEVFDRREHHHHKRNSTGAACKNCHMPETTYMVVDPRRDHSLRIPDPQISVEMGTPNACSQCHKDEDASWAQKHSLQWYGTRAWPVFAETFNQAAQVVPGADRKLATLALDKKLPSIVRATAAELLHSYPGQVTLMAATQLIHDPEPLVRRAAVGLMELLPTGQRFELLSPLLEDSHATVKLAAARLLATAPLETLSPGQLKQGNQAMKIVIDSSMTTLDAPDIQSGLAQLYAGRGQYQQAEKAYQQALLIEPAFLPALLNLADLYRAKGEDWKSKPVLNKALSIEPEFADAHYAMGLLLVRQKRYGPALEYLSRAAELRPNNIRFQYVYAVALADQGKNIKAIETLENALQRRPNNSQLLSVLANQFLTLGKKAEAEAIFRRLQQLNSNTGQLQQ